MIPSIEVFYVYVPGEEDYDLDAQRYVTSYLSHRSPIEHKHTVIWMDTSTSVAGVRLFYQLPHVRIIPYDNIGWDIGAYIAMSKLCDSDIMVCFGSNIRFTSCAWLDRIVSTWNKCGSGLYGISASFEISPHINTTGFWCSPKMLSQYPFTITSKEDRYDFEHGHAKRSLGLMGTDTRVNMTFWKTIHSSGSPVKLVTWDGEWDWWDWRTPTNIFRRGDQSNMIVQWKHSDGWMSSNSDQKRLSSLSTDLLTDPCFNLKDRTYKNVNSCTTPHFFKNPYEYYMRYMRRHGML